MKIKEIQREHRTMLRLDLAQKLNVALIGCGGNGSKMLSGLRHLHLALQALGHHGLHVIAFDPDTVSESNLARQSFYASDIGLNKARVLINRLNLACGLDWEAVPAKPSRHSSLNAHLVISCVDSRASRAELQSILACATYWMDLGNNARTGQVVIGTPEHQQNKKALKCYPTCALPTAAQLFPELIDTRLPEEDTPSCSTLEALERQDLFVNDAVVQAALNILWRLFRHGATPYHGAFINLETGLQVPIPVKPYSLWDTKAGYRFRTIKLKQEVL